MNQQPQQRISHLIRTLQRYFPVLIIPAIVGLVLALAYAFLLMPETWTARQSFLIRDDLSGTAFKLGRFDSEESRKSAQETILEVARRPLVVRKVLEELGPKSSLSGSNWITDEVIEDTQSVIDISAPNGAEFGKTDAIVLTAKASTRERTRNFIDLLSKEIINQTNRIRSLRFESMEDELYQGYQAAEQARDDAIDRLDKLDQRLGSDFGFLSLQGQNNFQQPPSGVEGIKSEILRKQDELEKAESVHAALLKAFDNPAAASQLPSEVLVAQPALQAAMAKMLDLREELHIAKGLLTNRHPRVKGISEAIEFSQQQLYDSLTGEMAGVQSDIALKKRQLARLKNRIEELKARLIRLSKSRSEHLALTTQVQQLGEAANRAKTVWTETKAQAKTARTVGLITPTDVAQVNSRPDGIGKKAVALAGLFGGLLVGIGLVLLIAPPMDPNTNGPQGGTVSPQSANRQARPSQVPQHRTSNLAASSVASGSFQQAASAMQSAADAMRMAATGETTASQSASLSQPELATRPRPAQSEPPRHPAANAPKPIADEAVRMAFQNQSSTALPRDARSQPITGQPNTSKSRQRASAKTKTDVKENQIRSAPQNTERAQPAGATAATQDKTNVRPVDLAKSASVKDEFVQVQTATEKSKKTFAKADTVPAGQPERQQTEIDSSVSKMAPANANTASTSNIATQHSQHDGAATFAPSDHQKPDGSGQSAQQRKPTGTEGFTVASGAEASQPPNLDQDVIDAIPAQIRKLSDSILNFGKDKK